MTKKNLDHLLIKEKIRHSTIKNWIQILQNALNKWITVKQIAKTMWVSRFTIDNLKDKNWISMTLSTANKIINVSDKL